jgi:hypothetical protein
MPDSVLSKLEDTQAKHDMQYDVRMHELMNLLPDKWFNDKKNINLLIDITRNTYIVSDVVRINTLCKLFYERWDAFDEKSMILEPKKLTYKQQQINISTLQKIVRSFNIKGYEIWARKWYTSSALHLRYRKDSLVKLSKVKAIFDKPTLTTIMANHPKFKIVRRMVCKSCNQPHIRGCCDEYNRTNRSTASLIMNAYLAK